MKEKQLIDKCRNALKDLKSFLEEKNQIIQYGDEPIVYIFEQLLILIEAKDEERKMHIQDNNMLYDRLSHLLMSDTIKKYDEKDGKGNYVRDISKLDEILKENEENFFEKYIEKEKENSFNQGVIYQLQKDMMLYEQIGYLKGKNKVDPIPLVQ